MRGVAKVEELDVFERIADGLNMPDPARIALGLAPTRRHHGPAAAAAAPVIPSRDTRPALPAPAVSGLLSADAGDSEEDDPSVRRRTFVGLTGASLFGAVLADTRAAARPTPSSPSPPCWPPTRLTRPVRPWTRRRTCRAGRRGRPRQARLPGVPVLGGDQRPARPARPGCRLPAPCSTARPGSQAYTLSAEAHHVAASILLKAGDQGLGWLAADRSMQAARASEDPVTIASSARIITHALMSSEPLQGRDRHGQHPGRQARPRRVRPRSRVAVGLRLAAAARRDRRRPARRPRAAADELLTEAEDAAGRLGEDAEPALDGVRPDQRQPAPGQHRRHPRRRGHRDRRRPHRGPRQDRRHRAQGQLPHGHRPRVPAMRQARTGLPRPARRRGDRPRGDHRPPRRRTAWSAT